MASAQTGATTICIEPMNFLGGIGAGGGIHAYYYGVTGGLQQTLDRKIKDLMQRSGKLLTGGSFNPDAKKYVLEQALRQAGVQLHLNSCLAGLEKSGNTITAALVATDHGLVRMQAKTYIDGTGDGDLCAMAGATFTHGRSGDGLPHAYSQSGGMLHYKANEDPGMTIVNFDAGWCDATDAQDLTRARMVGLLHYLKDHYTNLERPTYLAPAIGLRQSRQVVTDHVLSLDDLVIGRRFEDVIGYSGCHYDNHAVDYDQESDEALFWIWLNRNWRNPVAAQMPYRMLLPKGLDNVWIASRCAGVSQDAHHSLRMQRDMQRIGEAAGIAAALCATAGTGSRLVNHAELKTPAAGKRSLESSGKKPHRDLRIGARTGGL
ncbi:MAG: FAD-dependent oxidoreductase [Phycisphaerales bacterium]|nr:FAD-dependent oxidoreductase [Phycisphaerales bacterium]